DAIVGARLHIIATMRSKMEYVQEKNEHGKTVVRKVGMQPVQRDGLEYEFDVVADLNQENDLIVGKTRCPALFGQIYHRAGENVAEILQSWLTTGQPLIEPVPQLTNGKAAIKDTADAERRFFTKFGPVVGGTTWEAVQAYVGTFILGHKEKPTT